jgi:phage terminase large subunit GpA-like protein
MVGANSAKQLRSMAARYLFLDEVDAYPDNVGREGEPCDLAIARTTNFRRKKIFITSTPTLEGRSRIAHFFAGSDQCYYFVPCPRCERMIVLLPEQLQWSTQHKHQAAYNCQECQAEIYDHEKTYMLERGEWRATATGDGITRGYHLSSYYSPVGWLSWTQILRKRDKAEGKPEKLQTYYNTVLGLPWMDQGEVPDVDRLYERRESYLIGEVPEGGQSEKQCSSPGCDGSHSSAHQLIASLCSVRHWKGRIRSFRSRCRTEWSMRRRCPSNARPLAQTHWQTGLAPKQN